MRFMVLVKASEESEGGRLPTEQELATMTAFNEELAKAGVMLEGEGLHPSSKGARVTFSGNDSVVTDGPFAEAKELIAGYWIWQTASLDEAIDWVKKAPFQDGQVEIRQVYESDDMGEAFTPELREKDEQLRAQTEKAKRS
jgi:hypothetical protein